MKCDHSSTLPVSSGPLRPPLRPMTAVARTGHEIDPDLVGVDRPLRERVAEVERADHDFDQVSSAPA